MDLFLRVIQGAYAYVLVFLILVVSGLTLTLIYLIAKRTKEAGELVAVTAGGIQPASIQEIADLKAKITSMEAEREKLKQNDTEKQSLLDKVKYLESKLLEYEILQEEIGTLSALKLENEKLRATLMEHGLAQKSPTEKAQDAIKPDEQKNEAKIPTVGAQASGAKPSNVPSANSGQQNPSPLRSDDEIEGLLKQIDELTQSAKHTA